MKYRYPAKDFLSSSFPPIDLVAHIDRSEERDTAAVDYCDRDPHAKPNRTHEISAGNVSSVAVDAVAASN